MARLIWSSVARDDLKEIVTYIRAASPGYAKSFALRLQRRVTLLQAFPDSGRLVPEDPTGTYRELVLGNYRIIYRHVEDTATIVTIVHGARSLQLSDSG